MRVVTYCLGIVLVLSLSACGAGKVTPLAFPEGSQEATDNAAIVAYIQKNKLKKVKNTESGIYYIIEKEGKGENPTAQSTVKTHYHGTLLNGDVFDSSVERDEPLEFPLKRVIKGWQESLPLLKVGGKGKFIIPSELAYGSRSAGPIPPNSVLIFDIELLDIIE